MSLEITLTQAGARIAGELDMATASQLREFFSQGQGSNGPLELDVSGLSFMDSSGLEVLLRQAASRPNGAPLVLQNPTRPVLRVFEIAVPRGVAGLELEPVGADGLEMQR